MNKEIKEKEKMMATVFPVSEKELFERIAATQERKMAAELRIAIREHIKKNRHLVEA